MLDAERDRGRIVWWGGSGVCQSYNHLNLYNAPFRLSESVDVKIKISNGRRFACFAGPVQPASFQQLIARLALPSQVNKFVY